MFALQELDVPKFATAKQLEERKKDEKEEKLAAAGTVLRAKQSIVMDLDYSQIDTPEARFLFEQSVRRDLAAALGKKFVCVLCIS